jgi:hypothetical protein
MPKIQEARYVRQHTIGTNKGDRTSMRRIALIRRTLEDSGIDHNGCAM